MDQATNERRTWIRTEQVQAVFQDADVVAYLLTIAGSFGILAVLIWA